MKTPEILKIFTKHEFNEYNCPFFKSEDIVNIANELEQAISVTRCCESDSELLSCPNTSCPIIRYDNGESYCTKCDYTD
jgi:hypothetical protein